MASALLHRAGILIRALIYVPLWLLGLVMMLLGVALSPWGTEWLADQGQARGWYEVDEVTGAPLDTLTLRGLHLDIGTLTLDIDRLHLSWADDCLLDGKLCLQGLQVKGAHIALASSDVSESQADASSGSGGMPALWFPFPIEIRALALEDVRVDLGDGTQLQWKKFTTGARIAGNELTLLPTHLAGAALSLPMSEGQRLTQEMASPAIPAGTIDAASQASRSRPGASAEGLANDGSAVTGETPASPTETPGANNRLTLPEIDVPLDIRAPSVVVTDFELQGATPYHIQRASLALSAHDSQVAIHRLHVRSDDGEAELALKATLSGDYPLRGSLQTHIARTPLAGQRLSLTLAGSLADLALELDASGPVTADLEATLDALAPERPFSLSLTARDIVWPLSGMGELSSLASFKPGVLAASQRLTRPPAMYRLDTLDLDAEGSLDSYRVALDLAVRGQGLPASHLTLEGHGDRTRFAWSPLTLNAEGGTLTGRGHVDWSSALAVESDLQLDKLPVGAFTDVVDGTLNGKARIGFNMTPQGWQLRIPQLAIDGTLQDRALRLNAKLQGNSQMQWMIDQLDLRQGDNRITAEGQIGKRLSLQARIEAPQLATLWPGLGGALQGELDAQGALASPRIDLTLSGDALHYRTQQLQSLSLTAHSEGLEDPRVDAQVSLAGLEAGGQRVDTLAATLEGRLSQHMLDIQAELGAGMPVSRAALTLEGGYQRTTQHYQGVLAPLELATEYGDFSLDDRLSINADLAASQVILSPFCLVREQGGRVCLTERARLSAAKGEIALALRDMPMALFADRLPPGWRLGGDTQGDAVLRWRHAGQFWSAKGQLNSQLTVTGEDANGNPWHLPDSRLSLRFDATPTRADMQLTLDQGDAGQLDLTLGIDEPLGEGALEGRLRVDDIAFSPYRPLVEGLTELHGVLNGDVTLGGTIRTPDVQGRLVVDEVSIRGAATPVAITDARLALDLTGQGGRVDGFVAGEQGRLNLGGEVDWQDPTAWRAHLEIEGQTDPLRVDLPQFGRLRVAPDLSLDASPDLLRVRGDVRIPWGRLEVGQIPPSAVAPSSDEVIITREEDAARQQAEASGKQGEATAQALSEAGMALDVRITLDLGPDITLEAYGLETQLEGELEVRQESGPVQLFGNVRLIDGSYTAFGQDLLIRQGQILFSGPASQPRLQFEAIRNPDTIEDDVTAGLRVTGPAQNPQLSIFSEPAMPESRALSYLLRGRAPGEGGGDGALTSALIGLSLSQSGRAVGQLGQAFGVDDLSLDTAGAGEDSQVVVSGYVFDDLKVSYGVGIFSPIAELTLRYRLIQNLYLEAVSGAAQALDVIYTFSLGRSSASP
ncbi:autotransporter secretion inner membrane protein TamB [Chromohalobacter marismortui]|uniref:Autotransporter secretion inner membrane protein TamB n=1 Tax=Chromohalobacter marismortui TaxID=42055 RepID=A0A4R7NPH9_9GAMM|nr:MULTISPECIES: translocation/assembly module TamB domain-containing protein [Chromohalobacter]MCI0508948.1 translocation/assembly module TamB [Chromohalobacter sp.]MCI0592920.1 translocation/assembly module TamB [Chromohalobacter sp.]TDU22677.1 autotransporter secretion inner membrane protein TamB [Chromohalobacter marismortui]